MKGEEPSPTVQRAIQYLHEGEPLPMDIIARLLEEGIDVSQLEEKYAP